MLQERQEHLGNTYLEMAKVFSKANELASAIMNQQRAFETFSELEKYAETDYLAQIALNLSEF